MSIRGKSSPAGRMPSGLRAALCAAETPCGRERRLGFSIRSGGAPGSWGQAARQAGVACGSPGAEVSGCGDGRGACILANARHFTPNATTLAKHTGNQGLDAFHRSWGTHEALAWGWPVRAKSLLPRMAQRSCWSLRGLQAVREAWTKQAGWVWQRWQRWTQGETR